MKNLLFILLLTIPFIGFGQSTYKVNTGKEPISEKTKYHVYTEIEKFSVDYSSKGYVPTKKRMKDRRTFYFDTDNGKIGYITSKKIVQYDIVDFVEETGFIFIEPNPNITFLNEKGILWKTKKDYQDGIKFESGYMIWLTDLNSQTDIYETKFILYE